MTFRQCLQGAGVLVHQLFRQEIARTCLPFEPVLVRDHDSIMTEFHEALFLVGDQPLFDGRGINTHLKSEELIGERKRHNPGSLPMGFEPTRQTLSRRMELTTAHGNDGMLHEHEIISVKSIVQIGQTRKAVHDFGGSKAYSGAVDLNHGHTWRAVVPQHDGSPARAFFSGHGHLGYVFLVLKIGQADGGVDRKVKKLNGATRFFNNIAEV